MLQERSRFPALCGGRPRQHRLAACIIVEVNVTACQGKGDTPPATYHAESPASSHQQQLTIRQLQRRGRWCLDGRQLDQPGGSAVLVAARAEGERLLQHAGDSPV